MLFVIRGGAVLIVFGNFSDPLRSAPSIFGTRGTALSTDFDNISDLSGEEFSLFKVLLSSGSIKYAKLAAAKSSKHASKRNFNQKGDPNRVSLPSLYF